jgi:hypothetical protein
MISDAPEFVAALVRLNNTLLQEAMRARLITARELDVRRNALQEAKATLPSDCDARADRLRRALGLEIATTGDGGEPKEEVGAYDDAHCCLAEGGWWDMIDGTR